MRDQVAEIRSTQLCSIAIELAITIGGGVVASDTADSAAECAVVAFGDTMATG